MKESKRAFPLADVLPGLPDQHWASFVLPLAVVLGLALFPFITGKDVHRETMFTVLRAIVMAVSLNIILGYTGYVSFGHVVFYGLGGYVGFYLVSEKGMSLWVALLAGGLAAGLLAWVIGAGILRLRGAYFALVTIGVNEAVRALIQNLDIFGGPLGLEMNFSVYKAYGGPQAMLQMTYYILIGLAIIAVLLSYAVRTSKFGLGLLAIREDEDAAEVMGIIAPKAKTWAYVLSAILPGMVGALFFFRNGSIEPHEAFPLHISIEAIVMVMLGGYGTVLGPILGAAGYQVMRAFLITNRYLKNIQLTVSGVLLLLIVLFIPAGLIGWLRRRIPASRRILL